MPTPAPAIQQTVCPIREVAYLLPATPCDRCGQAAPRTSTADRVALDLHLDGPILLAVTISVHFCAPCRHYFRAQPPFLRPAAIYTVRVVQTAIQSVYADHLSFRRVPARLARDFWVQPSEAMIRQWCATYRAQYDFTTDYLPWVVREFSGILCVDEVYQGEVALLLAADPAAPTGDRLVGYQLVQGAVDTATVEAFLRRLAAAGIAPAQVITDGSPLYPPVLRKLWPTAAHQLCLFHETRHVTRAVAEVLNTVRASIPVPPPPPGRGWRGPLRAAPPSADPAHPARQRWELRRATRAAGVAQAQALAQQGYSLRAIGRQLAVDHHTVKAWLAEPPPAEPPAAFVAYHPPAPPPDLVAERRAKRAAQRARVQELVQQGLTDSAIARQEGLHRVTVGAWRRADTDQETGNAIPAAATLPETGSSAGISPAAESAPEAEVPIPHPAPAWAPPPPPDPWGSWEQVRTVRELVREHRFLLLRRPEHLTAPQQAVVDAILESPVGGPLRTARAFLVDWYTLWTTETGQRRSLEDAHGRYEAWRTNPAARELAPLRRLQERSTPEQFTRWSTFLQNPAWEATNNGAERTARAFRQSQAPHYCLRQADTIAGMLMIQAIHRKQQATPQARTAQRSRRGRPRSAPPLEQAA